MHEFIRSGTLSWISVRAAVMAEPILSEIHGHVMWNRLVSVVDGQAQRVVRTAFSTSVRESDEHAAVFDCRGGMLAQAVTGTLGHIDAMAEAVEHFISKHPVDTLGYLHDVTVVTPTFHRDRVVALFANTCHLLPDTVLSCLHQVIDGTDQGHEFIKENI